MSACADDQLRYSILDPTGNITALVESPVEPARQPSVAAGLMARHPAVEQVGFVRYEPDGDVSGELRMAGGEFCGNATMSAAALCLVRGAAAGAGGDDAAETRVLLRSSGAARPVEVRLTRRGAACYDAGVRMPAARGIETVTLEASGACGQLPLVRMEGISHLVIEKGSPLFGLKDDPARAERAVRRWCAELGADGLGLMFLEGESPAYRMTPLVYVPVGDTVFWEHSCASGSSAVGMCLASRAGARVDLALQEPGGTLRVVSDPASGETWLYGSVRLVGEYGRP